MSTIAQRLQAAMAERGIGQSELARRVGATPSTINKILRGKTANSRHLPKIAAELGVQLAALVGTDQQPEAEPIISALDRELLEVLLGLPISYRAILLKLSKHVVELMRKG